MLALFAVSAMTAAVAATPAPEAKPRLLAAAETSCKTNGRYEVADPALLYRPEGRAIAGRLADLPKANHEKAVLRSVEGCTTPVVVGYRVGR